MQQYIHEFKLERHTQKKKAINELDVQVWAASDKRRAHDTKKIVRAESLLLSSLWNKWVKKNWSLTWAIELVRANNKPVLNRVALGHIAGSNHPHGICSHENIIMALVLSKLSRPDHNDKKSVRNDHFHRDRLIFVQLQQWKELIGRAFLSMDVFLLMIKGRMWRCCYVHLISFLMFFLPNVNKGFHHQNLCY